ncbi:MAG: hypothetical protein U0800_14115 [Isosphaeraceae bacterium]
MFLFPRSSNGKRRRFIDFELLEKRIALAAIFLISRNKDFVGYDASVGPDGKTDFEIQLTGLTAGKITSADVIGTLANGGSVHWRYGDNPQGYPYADFQRIDTINDIYYPKVLSDSLPAAQIYIGLPPSSSPLSSLSVHLNYEDSSNDVTVNSSGTLDTSLSSDMDATRDSVTLPTAGGSATFQAQQWSSDVFSGQRIGDIRITLDSLPAGYAYADIRALYLSDGTGAVLPAVNNAIQTDLDQAIWAGSNLSPNPIPQKAALRLSYQQAPGPNPGYIADIAVPPIRANEAGVTMTLRMELKRPADAAATSFYTQFTGQAVDLNLVPAQWSGQYGGVPGFM